MCGGAYVGQKKIIYKEGEKESDGGAIHKGNHVMRLEKIGCGGCWYKVVTIHGKKCVIFLG